MAAGKKIFAHIFFQHDLVNREVQLVNSFIHKTQPVQYTHKVFLGEFSKCGYSQVVLAWPCSLSLYIAPNLARVTD